jgi:uncharacterized protein YcbX
MSARLAGLWIYPVKSAAGMACEAAVLTASGLQYDREWMLVDAAGRFLTQRELPQLVLLRAGIVDGALCLSTPVGPLPPLPLEHEGSRVEVQVWRSRCAAFDAGAEHARGLSDWLGRSVRLVRFDPACRRFCNHDWTQGRDVPNRFADGYPLLVLSQASVDALGVQVGRPLAVERFRPNVLIEGVTAYAEDAGSQIRIGAARLVLTKPSTRCAITTIDPVSGCRDEDGEPLATLKRQRFDAALRGAIFGRNAYALEGEGTRLRRGMPLLLE